MFVLVVLVSLSNIKFYSFFLIFITLAFPVNVDNFIPSILISSQLDITEVYYPLITHTDIFILLGVFRFYKPSVEIDLNGSFLKLILILIFLLLISLIFNLINSDNLDDISIMLASSFHFRYLILFYLLFRLTPVFKYKNLIIHGIIASVCFLILESIIYSFYYDTARLTSGSLKVNTFANILSATACYYLFLLFRKRISKGFILLVILIICIVIFTETRSALFIILIYFIFDIYKLIKDRFRRKFIGLSFYLITLLITFIVFLKIFQQNERISPLNFKIEEINSNANNIDQMIVLEENEFTESIVLRLKHLQTSVNMINKSPFFGIGPGLWNKYKNKFGSHEKQIMDSHNDFFASMSQYGIIQGGLLCLTIYFMPLYQFATKKKKNMSRFNSLFVINLIMFVAGFSNAGLFKHQVFGFLTIIMFISISYNTNLEKNETCNFRN